MGITNKEQQNFFSVAIFLLYISTIQAKSTVISLTQYPTKLQPLTSIEINCTVYRTLNEDQVYWRNASDDSKQIGLNGKIVLDDIDNLDQFGRTKYRLTETVVNKTTSIYTLTIPHLTKDLAAVYKCAEEKTLIDVETYTQFIPNNTRAEIVCDGANYLYDRNTSELGDVNWFMRPIDGGARIEVAQWFADQTSETVESLLYKDRMAVEHDRLIIDNVQPSDEGEYVCESSRVIEFKNQTERQNFTFSSLLYVKVKPQAPGAPVVMSSTSTSVYLEWEAPNVTLSSPVLNYSVQYIKYLAYEQAENNFHLKELVNISDITTTHYNITNLTPATQYAARVVAWNDMGATYGPTNSQLETNETKPGSPTVLDSGIYTNSINISWSVQGLVGKIQEFRLTIYDEAGTEEIGNGSVTIPAMEGKRIYWHWVDDLAADTLYCFKIEAKNSAGYSTPSNCLTVRTDIGPPESPQLVTLKRGDIANSTASVDVVFEPPACIFKKDFCVSAYKIRYTAENDTEYTDVEVKLGEITLTKTQRLYKLEGMALGYIYDVQIAAVVKSYHNRIYESNFSEALPIDLLKGMTTTTSGDLDTTSITTVIDKKATTTPGVDVKEEKGSDDETVASTTIIIAVVVSIIVLAAIVIIVIGLIYRRKRQEGSIADEREEDLWIDLRTPLLGPASQGYIENDYENVAIDSWADHIKDMHSNSDLKFSEEYESICKSNLQELTWKDSLEPANTSKNRYNNINSYDHSRVVLKTLPGVVHSDYINANYIDSYDKTKAFIATQGPLPNTLDDFWRMIWENNTSVIVMITNVYEKHKKKCEQYWPNEGESMYGKLSVKLIGIEELAFWTIRKFTVKNTKISKKKHQIEKVVVQYHYTDWPDHGVPDYTLPVLSFVKKACGANPLTAGPIVVHCSAGVGRTGTFIVLDSMMKQIMQKRMVNVQGFLRHIRSQRNHMVQNEDQYIFIHDALLDFIESGGRTDISPKKFRTLVDELDSNFDHSGETILGKQYKTIVKWKPPEYLVQCAYQDINRAKNRSDLFIPMDNSSRVRLPKIAAENGSDYINASYLHGYFKNDEYIVTQHPSAQTEYDFWRMVWDQNSMTIVLLSNIGEEDLVAFYRPKGESTDWDHTSTFKLTCTDEDLSSIDYTVRNFLLESKQDDYEMVSRMFSITCWPEAYTGTQLYKDGVFQFIEVVNAWHAEKRDIAGPVIVIDKYGGKVAAQFCALYTLYNQYHSDNAIDIYTLAYLYHHKRPGVWQTQDDYRLLFNSMMPLCDPEDDTKGNDLGSSEKLDYQPANTFANVRRINSLSRSPEHQNHGRVETL